MEILLKAEDKSEILRFLEYRGQEMDEELSKQIDRCMEIINTAAEPAYISREFDMKPDGSYPDECSFLNGNDIKKHLLGCKKIILMAATLGAGVENAIRRAQIKNVSDAVIMDSCASVLIEAVCDTIDAMFRAEYEQQNLFLTMRYSPGYGDLPISIQKDFIYLLDTVRRIGLNVSSSGIMIPRKSVTAIIGVSETERKAEKLGCAGCNLIKACRFLRRGVTCGR